MFTLTFFDGTVRHIRDDQARAVGEDLAAGKKHILIDGSLIALSGVGRLEPSSSWLADQRERLRKGDEWICDFGHRHSRGETCRCVDRQLIPLTAEAAQDVLALLAKGKVEGTLTSRGEALLAQGFPEKLATAYPDLPRLLE